MQNVELCKYWKIERLNNITWPHWKVIEPLDPCVRGLWANGSLERVFPDDRQSSVISTGVCYRCIVPSITVNTPVLNLGHCFLQHPYNCHVELSNNTDLPAKYELMPCSTDDGLNSVMYTSPQPEVCIYAPESALLQSAVLLICSVN